MKLIAFVGLIYSAMAMQMSPQDIRMQKEIWENTNVIEGDILVLPTSERLAATTRSNAKWANKTIYFNVDSSLAFMRDNIDKTIWHIQNNTCLRFVETQVGPRVSMFYLNGVCNSYVGYTGYVQPLRLYEGCSDVGSIAHEILHAAGFLHEHMRSDRNSYIRINWQNILTENYPQFQKLKPNQNILLNNFDFDSIMMYGEANGAMRYGLKAMESIVPGHKLLRPDEKPGLSQGDIEKVKEFYGC